MSVKKGSASKITGVTPKLFIKDDGTTYTTGETYNSLWSGNSGSGDLTHSTATGYANVGHWKFNELEGMGCDHDLETHQWILYQKGINDQPSIVIERYRY